MSASGGPHPHDQIVLFHLSDVHIGTSVMPAPDLFHGGLKAGYNPHDHRLLRPLGLAMESARKRFGLSDNEPLNVVISGDLTQSGLDNDYATAFGLLHHRWQWRFGPPARAQWIGLGLNRDWTHTVPGNHDHWRHPRFPTAHTRGLAPDFFEWTPWRHLVESRDGTMCLELYGVDSNSGLARSGPLPVPSPRAGGALSSEELHHLHDLLSRGRPDARPGQDIVRALVCHHAFEGSGWRGAQPLSEESRIDLLKRIVPHSVVVALTGHTHEFAVRDWPLDDEDDPQYSLREFCCATTLQGRKGGPGLQGFWVHRIVRSERGKCQWTALKYQFAAGDFYPNTREPVTFVIPIA